MRITLSALLVSATVLTACGAVRDSAINPVNWFGRSASVPVAQEASSNPLIPQRSGLFSSRRAQVETYAGLPFEEVIDLQIERVPGGAVIRVTGRAARQGIYAVQLTPANAEELPVDGVLTYRLEGVRPGFATPAGAAPTREVTAARKLTDQDLRGVNSIRVEGQLNARVVRR